MTDEELEARAAATVELLELLRDEPTRLAALDRQLYERLVKAAGQFARPGPWVKREIARAVRRRRRDQRRAEAEAELARTGIRKKRREAVYQTPAPATPTLVAAAAASPAAAPAAPLATARNCYICKRDYRELHHFYDSLCPACAELNWAKRRQTCDLSGRVALVSGGRVKIGYQAAVMLLRAGARVIVTTRFPRDAVARFLGESDAPEWRDRLAVYGLDLRHTPSVERFASHLLATVDRLDFLLNNACQTVRRPAGFYAHLLAAERRPTGELSAAAQRALGAYRESQEAALEPADAGGLRALAGSGELDALDAPALSQLPLLADDRGRDLVLFPEGELDADLQQVDRRGRNSWRLRLDEVSAVELLEVHLVNAVAPFVLNARLRWIFTPGSEAWLVYDEGRRFDLVGPSLLDRALILKVVHNFRF